MLTRILNLFKVPGPFKPEAWEGRLSPMTFRRFAMDDLPRCLDLYTRNEPGRFPTGFIGEYRKSLVEQNSYYLVTERDGQIIASGGMSYWMQQNLAVLSFGLVRPDYHGRGIGTALLLARLALLGRKYSRYSVFIFALENSIGFYRRFGFKDFDPWQDPRGFQHPAAYLRINSFEIHRCRQVLARHGISVPEDENHIPFRQESADFSNR